MTTRALAVVSAGLATPSSTRLLADRLATATVAALRERSEDATVEVVELRTHARDLADHLVTGFANGPLRAAIDTVVGADGLIAVTPVFSASYSGLFKTFFDVLDKDSLTGTPVLLGATAGTARHSLVIERTLGFREHVGDYQRQLFLIDHAGLPLKTVLEQLDLLGEEVVPVLRREFAALKPPHVPDAPTHASRVAARQASLEEVPA